MYYGEPSSSIMSRMLSRWPRTLGDPPVSGTALYALMEMICQELETLGSNVSLGVSSHVHNVTTVGESGPPVDPSPYVPPTTVEPEVKLSELPIGPSDFMPELKKV